MDIIKTDRLLIREFTLLDIEPIYHFSQEDSLKKWIPDQVYNNIDEARQTIEFLISQYINKTFPYVLAVVLLEDNKLIGHVGLSEIKQVIEIGYAISEKFHNQGYATEAVKAYSLWGKEHFKLNKIYGLADIKNIATCKVLEKAGFTYIHDDVNGEFDKKCIRRIYTI